MIEIEGIRLYTTPEICEKLGVMPQAIARLRTAGRLRYTQIGRLRYTSENALKDYLDGNFDPTAPKRERKARTDVPAMLPSKKTHIGME